MDNAETIRKALQDYDTARARLGKINGKQGNGTEETYSASWKKLVALGVKSKLRKKYSG